MMQYCFDVITKCFFRAYTCKRHVDHEEDIHPDFKPRTLATPRRLLQLKDFIEEDDFIEEADFNDEDNPTEEAEPHRHRRGISPTRPTQAGDAKKAKADPTTPQRQARVLAMTAVRGPAPRRPAQDDDLEAKYFAELVLAAVQKPSR